MGMFSAQSDTKQQSVQIVGKTQTGLLFTEMMNRVEHELTKVFLFLSFENFGRKVPKRNFALLQLGRLYFPDRLATELAFLQEQHVNVQQLFLLLRFFSFTHRSAYVAHKKE